MRLFAYWRQSEDRKRNIFCIHNISKEPQQVPLSSINLVATEDWVDLISGEELEKASGMLALGPYQCVWLANKRRFLPY